MEAFAKILTIPLFVIGWLGMILAYAIFEQSPTKQRVMLRLAAYAFVASVVIGASVHWLFHSTGEPLLVALSAAIAVGIVVTFRQELFAGADSN